MRVFPIMMTIMWITISTTEGTNILDRIGEDIEADVANILDPVEEVVSDVASKACIAREQFKQSEFGKASPDLTRLTLVLYSKEINVTYRLMDAAELIPNSPFFNCHKKIIIWLHGFADNINNESFTDIRTAALMADNAYILALDTKQLLGLQTLYLGAVNNAVYIGMKLGYVLAQMYNVGVKLSRMYLIGHSLGAHIAGFTGKMFKALTGRRLGRITGLDPAGPCYTDFSKSMRLSRTDAVFVDVMHTNAGVLGLNEQIGHADFYPNGGEIQPSTITVIGSHIRAWQLYSDTIRHPHSMPAVSCNSWEEFKAGLCNYSNVRLMGYHCNSSARGRYYLQTAGTEPYGLGADGIRYSDIYGALGDLASPVDEPNDLV